VALVDPSKMADAVTASIRGMAANGPKSTSEAIARTTRMGMTPRQLRLNHLWAWYTGHQYAHRKHAWDGTQHLDLLTAQSIAESGFAGTATQRAAIPLRYRRPTVPYRLATVIVDRFTSLLFSAGRHPDVRVANDPETEDWLNAAADAGRLWAAMAQARSYGGAVGTACLSFKFAAGLPAFEVHDPRWCDVEFTDRESGKVKRLTKLYMNSREELTREGWQTHWYWYRREITEETDTLFKPVRVDEGGKAPTFVPERTVRHNFGFCPVVWIQNEPDQHNLDGVSDVACVLELLEGIDQLTSQAHRGILANCDPTLVLTTDAELTGIQKGSDNAIKLPVGSDARYMEINGGGPAAALEMAAQLRRMALEVAQCVLENTSETAQTATEVERSYAAMLARADILREQYGQRGVVPLLQMVVKAAARIEGGEITGPDGGRLELALPPRLVEGEDGPELQDRTLPAGATDARVDLQWGPYFDRTVTEAEVAVRTAAAAAASQLVDKAHATKFVARYFDVADPDAMLEQMAEAALEQQRELDRQAMMAAAVQNGDADAMFAAADALEDDTPGEDGDE